MTTHHEIKQSIARCCANILYGNYTRKQSPTYKVHHTFAGVGVSFLSTPERIDLAQLIIEHLGSILDKHHKVCSVVITSLTDEETGKILVSGQIRRQ